jgi:hypothetical protein
VHRVRWVLFGSVALASACGGVVTSDPGQPGTGGVPTGIVPDGGAPSRVDAGSDASVDAADADGNIWSDYVPQECPDRPPPEISEDCDVFGDPDGCSAGTACLPYVEYPDGSDPCAGEHYGAACFTVGDGVQGEPCDWGTCAAQHLCVLTGDGTQCVQLCDTFGENTCPAGLFCEPIDVQPGLGGCY